MKLFKSLKRPLLSKDVEEQIKRSITSRIYKQGDKLPSELELAHQFNVSRATLRVALKNLQSQELINVKRGIRAGAYISEPSSKVISACFENLVHIGKATIISLIEVRLCIEPALAGYAAIHRTSEDINRLTELLDRAKNIAGISYKESRLMNIQFHTELTRISKNIFLIFLTESITQVFSDLLAVVAQNKPNKSKGETSIRQHQEILKAVVNKNPGEAFKTSKKHILWAYSSYLNYFGEGLDNIEKPILKEFLRRVAIDTDFLSKM